MDGKKIWEYRTKPTHVRGRVYVYASLKKITSATERWRAWANGGFKENLPTGKIIGSVEITGCVRYGDNWRWRLENPKRLRKMLKPARQPQPTFFIPF